ncbi:MAG: Holliday junction branch migration protein RuvA [Candidatus Wallbacteria bacterium HGW-Wallbacteria-1]|jgi:Holliday junction DNA helicase RuvA|uniref:Holliday junction branch migration complex subunit RuvA n=1 Tax=Candidatus Wallbacteria bacterium HGW-Wallbacteria-1 TaxID=2013854 RepID=A0A2N1PQB3_9BACT|nr:MAG: Holliday junction branch migration protein RuvA [Candidatus Wallbacteria bacterium HGW-Wallbacteria-1]
MLNHLKGILVSSQGNRVVIDVSGFGMELAVSSNTLSSLPAPGSPITIMTHMAMRDDSIDLFGFSSDRERELFRYLITIPSIGPKIALGILSNISPESLFMAVMEENIALLTKLPGVGKKTAQRLILELRDKFGTEGIPSESGATLSDLQQASGSGGSAAVEALVSLGYTRAEIRRAMSSVKGVGTSAEELIQACLAFFYRGK